MDEYISRNEAINAIKSLESSMPAKDNYAKGYDAALGRALIAVREAPPAADQPVKHGYWTDLNNDAIYHYECSCCKGHTDWHENFCPNCGAKMDIIYEDDKIRAIKVTGWDNDVRNLTDEEIDIYNNRLEAEAKTIDEISLL
jgi:hypothetical protein